MRIGCRFLLSALALWIFIFTGCGTGDDGPKYSQTKQIISELIKSEMENNQVTGLGLALVDGRNVIWMQGFGWANREKGIPYTSDTFSEIGSVSKTFTSAMLSQFAGEGLVDLDGPLTDYLPEFSIGQRFAGSETITLRMMLTHTSGLPTDDIPNSFSVAWVPAYNEMLLNYLSGVYTICPANLKFNYSNIAVSLLGEIVARKKWDEFAAPGEASGDVFVKCGDAFLNDIGMAKSTWKLPSQDRRDEMAMQYYCGQPVDTYCYINIPAAGSIWSSPKEMAEYLKMLLNEGRNSQGAQILLPSVIEDMWTPHNMGAPLDYGSHEYGIRVGNIWILSDPELAYAGRLAWHNGASAFGRSHLIVLPEHKLGVIVLSESATAGDVVAKIARETLKETLREKTGLVPVTPPGPVYSPTTTWPQEQLEAIAGTYVTSSGTWDEFRVVPDGLEWIQNANLPQNGSGSPMVSLNDNPLQKLPLESQPQRTACTVYPLENGWFGLPDQEEQKWQLKFETVKGYQVVARFEKSMTYLGKKQESFSMPDVWNGRQGIWEVANLSPDDASNYLPFPMGVTEFSIRPAGSWLLLGDAEAEGYIVDVPSSDVLTFIAGFGRNNGGSIQSVTVNGEEQLQFMGSLFRKRN